MAQNLLHISTRCELREWLQNNAQTETECWVLAKRGTPKDHTSLWYLNVVEEALCFGWIDSIFKHIDGFGLAQKLSPRAKNSMWSELNKERCRRLEKLGLMTNAGRSVLPDMSEYSFVVDKDIQNLFKQDTDLAQKFYTFPLLYQRIRINCIQREKKLHPEIYEKVKKNFIEKTKQGKMYGQWNDYGRLLSY